MGAHKTWSTAVASLLLATLAFSIVVAESHQHDSLELSSGHGSLPAFSAGHEQPDRTVHIETATRLETESCVGCLQRPRTDGRLEPILVSIEPSSLTLAEPFTGRVAIDARRLPASRAPPGA